MVGVSVACALAARAARARGVGVSVGGGRGHAEGVHIFIDHRRPGEYSVAPRVEWRTPRGKVTAPARR